MPETKAWLMSLANDIKQKATGWVAEYLVGDQSHGLKHYSPYKYITVEQSGGWKSDKQRRYVMAMINEGKIDPGVPHRTGELQRGWKYAAAGSLYTITNDTPYGHWVMGPGTQTQMHAMGGWRTTVDNIADNIRGAIRHAQSKVNEWLRRK